MKVRDILRRLNKEGWTLTRQKGSHRQFHHPDMPERRVTVHGHPSEDLQAGTLAEVYKQAGWEKDY